MGFWPFGGGKKQRAAEPTKHARDRSLQSNPSEKTNRLEKTGTEISGNTKSSAQQEPGETGHRLSKTRLPGSQQQLRSQTEPIQRSSSRRLSQPVPPFSEKAIYQQNPASQSSLGPENFNVVRQSPRLTARKPEHDSGFARRKSSKRKAEDYAREREVRAMSTSPIPIPRRPTSFYDSGPLQRETRDVPGPFSRKSTRPASQVSLPLPDGLPDVYDGSYQNSFKVGMFAALSPRPTIKYDANPKHQRGKQPQRPKPVIRPSTVEEETDADKKRIDDLADDLDAGGLRELMERDRRRREKKRKDDQARLQRRLERRAERQREEEARKARTEEYVSASASRAQGIDLDPVIANDSAPGPSRARSNPFADSKSQPASPVVIRNPFEDEKDLENIQDPGSDAEPDLVVPARSPLRKIQTDMNKVDDTPVPGTLSPPRSPVPRTNDRQSMSQASLLHREATADLPESASFTGAASDHSSQRLSSWTAFFRRGTRRKLSSSFQGRSTPSEFSNTSRESFARKQPPPVVAQRTFRRPDSTTPQRTMSKFREDLPEFPVSPPDSRMQSPETSVPPLTSTFNQSVTVGKADEMIDDEAEPITTATSKPIPTGPMRSENRAGVEPESTLDVKQELLLSQSLASVDSEASWLSGKPLNRRSGASQRLQPSRSSLTRPMPGAFDGALPIPSPLESSQSISPGATAARDEDEAKDETWHAAVARQPTVVRQASRAKSREGLLNEYLTAGRKQSESSSDDDDDDSPGVGLEEPEPAVALGRAKSVEYRGGHGRQISAGSARLLDIRRSSTHSTDLLRTASVSRDKLTNAGDRSSVGF